MKQTVVIKLTEAKNPKRIYLLIQTLSLGIVIAQEKKHFPIEDRDLANIAPSKDY